VHARSDVVAGPATASKFGAHALDGIDVDLEKFLGPTAQLIS
jgi:hypothetical protein